MTNNSVVMPAMACLVLLTVLSGVARAGYKDQPCTNCTTQTTQHVNVQVIHIPRPGMLHIPDLGERRKVQVHYQHYYAAHTAQNIAYIDRRKAKTRQTHHRAQAEIILPEARPLAILREGVSRIFRR